MSMLKKLKGIFVVEDESTAKKNASESEQQILKQVDTEATKAKPEVVKSSEEAVKSSNVPVDKTAQSSNAKPDPKFIDVLLKALEANNQEGFDYLEFKQSLQNLSKVDMDEKTRYQSAMAMAKTMNANSKVIIQSAKKYAQVLDQEGVKFKKAADNQRTKQVTGKEQEIKSLEKSINTKQAQIEKLKKEIEAHKLSLEKTKGSINNAAAKVQLTNDKFMAAFNVVKGQILADIEKLERYL